MPGIDWNLSFKIVKEVKEVPPKAKLIAEEDIEDHLERLYITRRGTFYRYAGGGRGFYWTQMLKLVRSKSK